MTLRCQRSPAQGQGKVSQRKQYLSHHPKGTLQTRFSLQLEFDYLQEPITLLFPLLYGENVCRLCGDISFCLFLRVKGPLHCDLLQRLFKAPFCFPFHDISFASFWSMSMVLFSAEGRHKDSFWQEGETRGSSGGKAPNVEAPPPPADGFLLQMAFPLQQPGDIWLTLWDPVQCQRQKALFPYHCRALHLDEAHFDYIMV